MPALDTPGGRAAWCDAAETLGSGLAGELMDRGAGELLGVGTRPITYGSAEAPHVDGSAAGGGGGARA